MTERILAIDQGGQSTRAIVFSGDGETLASCQMQIDTHRPGGYRVEHDPEQLARSVDEVVSEAVEAAGPVFHAGLATQRSSIVCWDRYSGAPLSPVLSWQDRRAAKLLDRYSPGREQLRALTGLVPSAHYGASKLRWCLDHIPAVQQALSAGRLAAGPVASYLLFRSLQDSPLKVDPVNASRTLLWDIEQHDWSAPLCDAFGIPMGILPQTVPNRHDFGTLRAGIPLTVCTGDQAAAVFAHGDLTEEQVYINVGTGAFLLAPVQSDTVPTGLLRSLAWQDSRRSVSVLEGTVNGAASAINAMVPGVSSEQVSAAAQLLGGTHEAPLFLNGVSGLGSPFWREDFESCFVGDGDTEARLVAVLESILFLLRENLQHVPGFASRTVVISGGLAQADGLCQGLADLSGMVVQRSNQPQATARGLAALVAGLPANWQHEKPTIFTPRPASYLVSRYSRWQKLMKSALR